MSSPEPSSNPSPSKPGASRPSFASSPSVQSRPPEDLSADRLLKDLPRDEQGRPLLGRIPIIARLGKGGMGAVYYGIHPRLNVEVAVKVLPHHLADSDPKLIERFVSEARMAVALENEHVVRVYDVDCEGDTYFLVMQFVDGDSAGGYLKKKKAEGREGISEKDAIEIMTAAARGLAAAHARGIIHRDIKPDNILIPKGVLTKSKLADLGLAKPEGSGQSMGTQSHVAMGTPGYMAPEQVEDAKTAGPPADVFSMGATLYSLLCGGAPFAGTSLGVILRDTATKEPKELPSGISQATRDIVKRCMAKDPAERYANGAELLAAFEARGTPAASQHVITKKRTPGKPGKEETVATMISAPPPEKKSSSMGIVIAVVVVLVLAGGGGVAFMMTRGKTEPATADKDKDKSKTPDKTPDKTPEKDPKADEAAKREAEAKEKESKIVAALKEAASLESSGKIDEAIARLASADPDDSRVKEAKSKLEEKAKSAKGAEQKRQKYEQYLTTADAARMTAEKAESWQKVIDAITKAETFAQTDDERKEAAEMKADAEQHRDWAAAKDSEAAGKLDDAIALVAKAVAKGKAAQALIDYQAALAAKKKSLDATASKRKEYESCVAQAGAEKDAVIAMGLWARAETLTDDAKEKEEARKKIEELRHAVAKGEVDKRYSEMMKQGEEALKSANFDDAAAKFGDALRMKEGDPAAKDGLARVETARKKKAYETAMAEAKDAESRKEWEKAKAAYEKALAAQPGDAAAAAGIKESEKQAKPDKIELALGGGVTMTFVHIKPGDFIMGDAECNGAKLHSVVLTRDYWIQTTEVTQGQWQAVMGKAPACNWHHDNWPVESVSWDECQEFLKALTAKMKEAMGGRSATLPTEAEWEYAARAGSPKKWFFGVNEKRLPEHGRFADKPKNVGEFKANDWGLCDVYGNVWEWCSDWYGVYGEKETDPTGPANGEKRVIRGGGYSDAPTVACSGARNQSSPTTKSKDVGFRAVIR